MLPTTTGLQKIEDNLRSIDVTTLARFKKKLDDLPSVNKITAPGYLRDFIQATDAASEAMSIATRCYGEAKAMLDAAESIAYLDRASDYLKGKNIKESSEARKFYIAIDSDVLAAKSTLAKSEAMVNLLKNLVYTFIAGQQAVKKIAYGDQAGTAWEGF